MNDKEKLSAPILRISLSLVFLYFGFQQVYSPDNWISFVPEFVTGFGLSVNNIVMVNGIMELILGIFMLIGLYTRFASFILSVHLLGIAVSVGFVPTGVKDFGLALATFVVFLNGADKYTLDKKMIKKKHEEHQEKKEEENEEEEE